MAYDVSNLEKYDKWIKEGKAADVAEELAKLSPSSIPRANAAAISKIALRVGATSFAFAVLRPIIQSTKLNDSPPTPEELLQFGMCLKQLGATQHALKVFSLVKPSVNPEVLLYRAITLFSLWKYAEAIPLLLQYINSEKLTEYQRNIGKLNLSSALIFEDRYKEAYDLLVHLLESARASALHLLQGHVLELLSQVFIYEKNWTKTEEALNSAKLLTQDAAPIYGLFLRKWAAVVELYKSKNSLASMKDLNSVREYAIELNHWESVRDCDFFFAVSKQDQHLFQRLHFGTPYPEYRQHLKRHFQNADPLPQYFEWRGNTAHMPLVENSGLIDLTEPAVRRNLDLIKALSTDFYAPIKPFALYLQLWPEDNLDPLSALPRIYSSVYRSNKWLEESNIPISIQYAESGYRLVWSGAYTIKVPGEIDPTARNQNSTILTLQKKFANQSFTSAEAAEILKLSKRTTIRVLNEALKGNEIESDGQGRAIRYRLKSA